MAWMGKDKNDEGAQYSKMLEKPVAPLILKLAVPTVISMLVTSVYNMADTYFVSHINISASGAVNVVFSLMAIIQALGFTLGIGCGSVISRALGVRDTKKASEYGSTSFFVSIGMGLLLTVFGLIFIDPLMSVLGSTDTVLPYARSYASYILYGAPIMTASFVLNNILRAEGKARLSMLGIATGGILNIGLDPLFIYTFGLGISGAAIATIISQAISFCIMLSFFVFGKTIVKLKPTNISRNFRVYLEIIKTGAPSFCRQGFASASTVLLNNAAAVYGDPALSAMGIVSKIFGMVFCVGLGIGQGYQPVVGYNYSAGKMKRVFRAYTFTYLIGTCTMTVFGVALFFLAPHVIPLFLDDTAVDKQEVIRIGVQACRYQAITMPLLATNVMCNMTYQSIGAKVRAVLLSCCRQGLYFIPLVLILPHFFGLGGVESVQAISDGLTFLTSLPFVIVFLITVRKKAKSGGELNG